MTFIEFIGLIISLIALALLSARQAREERRRRQNPEQYEREQEGRRRSLQETLREMHIEIEGGPAPSVGDRDDSEEMDEEPEEREEPQPVRIRVPVQEQPRKIAPTRMVQRSYAMPFKLKQFKQVRPIDQRRLSSALQHRRIVRDVLSRDMVADGPQDAYTLKRPVSISRGTQVIRSLRAPSDIVVLYALWGTPKGLQ